MDKKNHLVFANSKNTFITVNNSEASVGNNFNANEPQTGILRKTISNDISIDEDFKSFQIQREIKNLQIKKSFIENENLKIKINNAKKEQQQDESEAMETDNDVKSSEEITYSPIQGYRVLVSNLHPNVTEDDILVIK